MEQGSSASALAARTAGMTDEQILDLDLETLQSGGGVGAQGTPASSAGTPGDFSDEWEAVETSFSSQGAVKTSLAAEAPLTGDFGLGATTSAPGAEDTPGPLPAVRSTVPVDELLDDHATEFEECRRWASSDAGQIARAQNPAGFANVRAHAAEHAAALARQGQTSLAPKAP